VGPAVERALLASGAGPPVHAATGPWTQAGAPVVAAVGAVKGIAVLALPAGLAHAVIIIAKSEETPAAAVGVALTGAVNAGVVFALGARQAGGEGSVEEDRACNQQAHQLDHYLELLFFSGKPGEEEDKDSKGVDPRYPLYLRRIFFFFFETQIRWW